MKLIRQYPLLFLFSLLLLTTLACQIGGSEPPAAAEIDTDMLVEEAVATVQAQLAADEPVVDTAVTTNLPGVNNDLEADLINIYQTVNPAVVHIRVFTGEQDFNLPLGTGSGFLIDTDGHIVTNNHVVTDGDSFEVVFADGTRSDAGW